MQELLSLNNAEQLQAINICQYKLCKIGLVEFTDNNKNDLKWYFTLDN